MKLASVILIVLVCVTSMEFHRHGKHHGHGKNGHHGKNWWKKHATCEQKSQILEKTIETVLESKTTTNQNSENSIVFWDFLHNVTRFILLNTKNLKTNLKYDVVKELNSSKDSMNWEKLPENVKTELKTHNTEYYLDVSFENWGFKDISSKENKTLRTIINSCSKASPECLKNSTILMNKLSFDLVIDKTLFLKNVKDDINEMEEKIEDKIEAIKDKSTGTSFWQKFTKIFKKWTQYKKKSKHFKADRVLRRHIKHIEKYYFGLMVNCNNEAKAEKKVIKKNMKAAIYELVKLGVMKQKKHHKKPHKDD